MKAKSFTSLLFLIIVIVAKQAVHAQCSSSTKAGATVVSQTFNNGGADKSSYGFSNPDSVLLSDGKCATASAFLAILSGNTEYLKLTNFNFAIPPGATICGVQVTVRKKAAFVNVLSTVSDYAVYLVKNGVVTGTNKKLAGNWTTTPADFVYGSSSDKWGTTLTPTDVNASNFGIAFSAAIAGTISLIPSAKLDFMQITVYYQVSLPVVLSEFKANRVDDKVQLHWRSESETNFSHYEVERSSDGINFQNVATFISVPFTKEYFFTDQFPATNNFYRLKMVDLDNTFEYSGIVSAHVSRRNNQLLIWPNPVNGVCTLNLPGTVKGNCIIEVCNCAGQRLSRRAVPANQTSVQLSFSPYSKGLYFVKIFAGDGRVVNTVKVMHQ